MKLLNQRNNENLQALEARGMKFVMAALKRRRTYKGWHCLLDESIRLTVPSSVIVVRGLKIDLAKLTRYETQVK